MTVKQVLKVSKANESKSQKVTLEDIFKQNKVIIELLQSIKK